jgi:hypothetical protein
VPGVEACRKALETTSCEAARKLAGRYPEKARAAYAELLDNEKLRPCAIKGLRGIGLARCRAARELRKAGQSEEANKALVALTSTEPLLPTVARCAIKVLKGG